MKQIITQNQNQINKNLQKFENYFKYKLNPKSIACYRKLLIAYFKKYPTITHNNLVMHKEELQRRLMPSSVNQAISALNHYLKVVGKEHIRLTCIKVQEANYSDNVVDFAEYNLFKEKLLADGKIREYFILKTLACTGVRAFELCYMKVEHIIKQQYGCYGKGNKFRIIPLQTELCNELLAWCKSENRLSGYLFTNDLRKTKSLKMQPAYLYLMLKKLAKKYGLNESVIYPHSFRHFFSINFLENGGEKALIHLSNILGHSSVDMTRKYLKLSQTRLKVKVDEIVTWN